MTEKERAQQPEAVFRVGLTGGIASGKTTVADMFSSLGAQIIDTDELAREVVEPGEPALDTIIESFGDSVLDDTGNLDRRSLRHKVFANPDERHRLEQIVHPAIYQRIAEYSASLGGPYQVVVIPLLVETNSQGLVDRVLVVDCDEETQIRRLTLRDGETREQAEEMLAAQSPRQARLEAADDIIDGTWSLERLSKRVGELDQFYRELAGCLPQSER